MLVRYLLFTTALFCGAQLWAQGALNPSDVTPPGMKPIPSSAPTAPSSSSADIAKDTTGSSTDLKPNGKRIRRQVSLIVGITHDEEFKIPDVELVQKGRTEFVEIARIGKTNFFRFNPKRTNTNGITTLNDKKTGQILVEILFEIRDDSIDRTMREVQSMLADVEGIEFKIINNVIHIDGYVLLPHDLVRIAQAVSLFGPDKVKSIATLSPLARKKIVEYMVAEINNPEVKVTAIGEYIKLEGQVNSEGEKTRISNIVELYLPDLVIEVAPETPGSFVKILGRKTANARLQDFIINLINVKKPEEQVEPPPKMVQVVAHFVKLSDSYIKSFNFSFSPVISAQSGTSTAATTTVGETAQLINNLLPKLNWAKYHGYAKILDTASVLIQNLQTGSIVRTISSFTTRAGQNGAVELVPATAKVILNIKKLEIKSERSGLVLMQLNSQVDSVTKSDTTSTTVETTISVRDRQSAAFGGILKKDSDTNYGNPATSTQAIITLEASKGYTRSNSQFVVFVTPIIKSSASSGVEQVKKKFRLRD